MSGMLMRMLERPRADMSPGDPRAWSNWVPRSVAGISVTEDSAMRASIVAACVRILAESIASTPLHVYIDKGAGERERAVIGLTDVLEKRPNRWQTSFEWREMMMGHMVLRGNAYSRKIMTPGTPFTEGLIPLHPGRVEPALQPDGTVVYHVRRDDGSTYDLDQAEIFHLRGLSSDGVKGLSPIEMAKDSIGLAMAAEQYGARFFAQDASPKGVLKHPKALSAEARANLKASWNEANSGLANAHRTVVLEEGMEWSQVGMTSQDAQFLETRKYQVADIARRFGIPLPLLGEHERSTTWGTGIEQFMIMFVTHTLRPWAVRWEQAIQRDLIVSDAFYAEFNLDGLLRADTATRVAAYQIAAGGNAPWMTRNEIRKKENMRALPGLDEMLSPLNMRVGQGTDAGAGAGKAAAAAELLASNAAARIVRKECTALRKAAVKHAGDGAAWDAWLGEFYAKHAGEIVRDLHVDEAAAAAYCQEHTAAVREGGLHVAEESEPAWVTQLAALALGEEVAA
jgi:HK97 family phage portal protein